jgi:hypothetical protein
MQRVGKRRARKMLNAIVIEDAFEMRFLLRLSLDSVLTFAILSPGRCHKVRLFMPRWDDNYCYLSEPFSLLCSLLLREY